MSKADLIYQKAVDLEAEKLLKLNPSEFIAIEDYGVKSVFIENREIEIGWWHIKYTDYIHHIFFQTERRFFIPLLYKKFLNGAKLENNQISLLSLKEIADYD